MPGHVRHFLVFPGNLFSVLFCATCSIPVLFVFSVFAACFWIWLCYLTLQPFFALNIAHVLSIWWRCFLHFFLLLWLFACFSWSCSLLSHCIFSSFTSFYRTGIHFQANHSAVFVCSCTSIFVRTNVMFRYLGWSFLGHFLLDLLKGCEGSDLILEERLKFMFQRSTQKFLTTKEGQCPFVPACVRINMTVNEWQNMKTSTFH